MATLTLNIPAGLEQELLDGFCLYHRYETEGVGLTKLQFARKRLLQIIVSDSNQGYIDQSVNDRLDIIDTQRTELEQANTD